MALIVTLGAAVNATPSPKELSAALVTVSVDATHTVKDSTGTHHSIHELSPTSTAVHSATSSLTLTPGIRSERRPDHGWCRNIVLVGCTFMLAVRITGYCADSWCTCRCAYFGWFAGGSVDDVEEFCDLGYDVYSF